MAILEWTEKLDVKVDAMNEQHKILIAIMNRLHDQFSEGADHASQSKTLNDLADFCIEHFNKEEKYMASIEYPKLESHKRIHKELIAELTAYKEAFDRGGNLESKFFAFLKLWLTAHIQGIDRRYSEA